MAVLRCPACGAEAPEESGAFACGCGELFDVEHAFPAGLSREALDGRAPSPGEPGRTSGVWRFRDLVYPGFPPDDVVTLGEGETPLYASSALATYVGAEHLRVKHEGMNPTGSFKDRGMTVAVSRARASGARWLACASTGNTSASLAAYAASGGLRSLILIPEGAVALGKLSQAVAHGATTVQVRGDFDHAMRLVREVAEGGGVALLNSANPFRIEGQKTIVLETLAQLDWDPPEWIVFPAGNLGNCAAFGKALREALGVGIIDRAPRLAAVQAEGASPFAAAFARDFDGLVPMEADTVATAIRIGDPVSYRRAVRSVRETEGTVLAVDDAAILDAKSAVDAAGLGAEPASCASIAGARELVRRGDIAPGDRVVCVLTGHLLKDPGTTIAYHSGELGPAPRANPPVTLDADADAIRAILEDE